MSVLTGIQEQVKDRSIRDVIAMLDGILSDAPDYTGQLEIHVKDGTVVDIYSRRRYSVFDRS